LSSWTKDWRGRRLKVGARAVIRARARARVRVGVRARAEARKRSGESQEIGRGR